MVTPDTRKVLLFILKIISDKTGFFFWLFIRFISAILPLITIYQFSLVIRQLENRSAFSTLLWTLVLLFLVRILDNYLRLKSITRLDNAISNIGFDIQNYFLTDLKAATKEERHATIQAVRNFSDASTLTLSLFKQPGVDSLVSLLSIPVILFTRNWISFVLVVAYILIYYFIDLYTTQRYAHLKDIQNTKTETYYGKLQDSNDFDLEQHTWCRHYHRLCLWNFTEWFYLQNNAVFFNSLILLYLIYTVAAGQKDISELVLIAGYVSQVQPHLNSFSQIKDSFTDMMVGLRHLAANNSVSVLNLSDLI